MDILTTEERAELPESAFAIPEERAYPIMDRVHAINALARVSQHGSEDEKRMVRFSVFKHYPDLKEDDEDTNPDKKDMANWLEWRKDNKKVK